MEGGCLSTPGLYRDRCEAWGYKLDIQKGVIVQIWEDEWMPVDADGNRADCIVSSNSTVARSNWGREFIPYFAAAARDVRKMLLKMPGLPKTITQESLVYMDDQQFNDIYNKLLTFYAYTAPAQFWWYTQKVLSKEDRAEHLERCFNDKIYLRMPIDNPINEIDAVLHLERDFPQTYGPVTYRGVGGDWVTTKNKVRITPVPYMLLEKIADDGSSASIGKLQHHGLLASQTRADKYSQNYRSNHTRNTGEAEARLLTFYAKSIEAIADIHDRSNNPETMRHISRTLLSHPTPTNIESLVDRNVIEYGGSRPLQFLQHFMMTQGAKISHMPESEAMRLGAIQHFEPKR